MLKKILYLLLGIPKILSLVIDNQELRGKNLITFCREIFNLAIGKPPDYGPNVVDGSKGAVNLVGPVNQETLRRLSKHAIHFISVDSDKVNSDLFSNAENFPFLKTISIRGQNTAAFLPEIADLSTVTDLYLQDNHALTDIGPLPLNIETLHIENFGNIAEIQSGPKLTRLMIRNSGFNDDAVSRDAMQILTELILIDVPLSMEQLGSIAKLPILRRLTLSGKDLKVSEKEAAAIAKGRSLKNLEINAYHVDADAENLLKMQAFETRINGRVVNR